MHRYIKANRLSIIYLCTVNLLVKAKSFTGWYHYHAICNVLVVFLRLACLLTK